MGLNACNALKKPMQELSIISWPRPTPVTYFPYDPVGDDMFNFFVSIENSGIFCRETNSEQKQVVTFHPIKSILAVQEWKISEYGGQFGLAFITFLYVDILDCTGTLYSMARFCGAIDEKTQDFEGSAVAYLVDAFGISIGALMGTPPVTAFIESGAGISEGGATGLTAIVTGLCFFISIFFAPIFASIPPWATGCTLIIVGSMMAKQAKDINWSYVGDAVPAFLTIAIMPFTYSIAYGLIAGIMSYILLNTLAWLIEKASGGRIKPKDKQNKEPWTYKLEGGILPPWVTRAAKGKKDFWRPYDDEEHHSGIAPPERSSSDEMDEQKVVPKVA